MTPSELVGRCLQFPLRDDGLGGDGGVGEGRELASGRVGLSGSKGKEELVIDSWDFHQSN